MEVSTFPAEPVTPSVIVQIVTSAVWQGAEVAVAIVELVGEALVFALLFFLVGAFLQITV